MTGAARQTPLTGFSRLKATLACFGIDAAYVILVRAQDSIGTPRQFKAAVPLTVIEDNPVYNILLVLVIRIVIHFDAAAISIFRQMGRLIFHRVVVVACAGVRDSGDCADERVELIFIGTGGGTWSLFL